MKACMPPEPGSPGEMSGAPAFPPVHEPLRQFLRDLRTTPGGLTSRETARRLVVYGLNELSRRGGRTWSKELARQFTHPLVLLLWTTAALALVANTAVLAAAIIGVIVLLNTGFAFWQEQQAERAVEALTDYLPLQATALRDNRQGVPARGLVLGDVLLIEDGDAISTDAPLLEGLLEVDLYTLTGESTPVERYAGAPDSGGSVFSASDLVFSGTVATSGSASVGLPNRHDD